MSSNRLSFLAFFKKASKRNDKVYFFGQINSFNLKMSIITAFPGIKRSVVYPFCVLPFLVFFLWNWPSHFLPYWVCVDLVTMSCCFQAPRQLCWCLRPPVLRFLVIFFSPHRPTDPKPGNLFHAKRTKTGWPKPHGFFLGFLTTLLLRISVYFSFAFFCSFLSVK